MEINRIKQELKEFFIGRPDVLMAFLFGSRAKQRATLESDIDIAVYFVSPEKRLEWEELRDYPQEDEILDGIEKITGCTTDLIVLNRVPAMVAFGAIQEGQPIFIRDYALYLNYYLCVSQAAEDFRTFIADFWKIKLRSRSLSSIDKARIIRIIDFLETELEDFHVFQAMTQLTYMNDSAMRRNVERWVENIVNSSIDTAKILLASEKKAIPQTYRETLQLLATLERFDQTTAEKLSQYSKLRNILAHEYLDLRYENIRKFLDDTEPSYKYLLNYVKDGLKNV